MKFSVREKQKYDRWAFLTPAVILIFLMNFIPIIKAILMSFKQERQGMKICRIYRIMQGFWKTANVKDALNGDIGICGCYRALLCWHWSGSSFE